MRLPTLSLASLRPPGDLVERVGGRRTLLYALYTAVLFAAFMVANFDYDVLVDRVLRTVNPQEHGIGLAVGRTRFAWWRGWEVQGVTVGPLDPEQPAFVDVSRLYLRPGLAGLWRGQLSSVSLVGYLYGGQVDAAVSAAGGLQRVRADLDGLQLQRYPLFGMWLGEGAVAGRLSGAFTIESRGADLNDANALGELFLDKASIANATVGFFPIPALRFDKASLKFNLQGGRLDIQALEASGPDARIALSGQIVLREPLPDSVLNLRFSVHPTATSPEEIKNLIALLPPPAKGAKPDAGHSISGTIAHPRLH